MLPVTVSDLSDPGKVAAFMFLIATVLGFTLYFSDRPKALEHLQNPPTFPPPLRLVPWEEGWRMASKMEVYGTPVIICYHPATGQPYVWPKPSDEFLKLLNTPES